MFEGLRMSSLSKISIITVTYNSAATIEDTVCSVLSQEYPNIEYIVVDGASKDRTMGVVGRYRNRIAKMVSEPDRGVYDAMNKGVGLATGEIVGILHSDDVYADSQAISRIAGVFEKERPDTVFGDLVMVDRRDTSHIIRYYRGENFRPELLAWGWMPPHPTFFVKRECYLKYGVFKTDYKIAGDYDLIARFLWKARLSYSYLPGVLVKMRVGGISTRNFRSTIVLNKEIVRACRENGIQTNLLMVYSKYFSKIWQRFRRPE
jgi:glycosyltransferase involved in cell wall biosynthesis